MMEPLQHLLHLGRQPLHLRTAAFDYGNGVHQGVDADLILEDKGSADYACATK
jgi:hypothetical protein